MLRSWIFLTGEMNPPLKILVISLAGSRSAERHPLCPPPEAGDSDKTTPCGGAVKVIQT